MGPDFILSATEVISAGDISTTDDQGSKFGGAQIANIEKIN
jgi:hypothetical protein